MNAIQTRQSTIATSAGKPKTGLAGFHDTLTSINTQDYLNKVLGEKKNSFVNNISSLVANSAALQACEPRSIIYAGIKATALDLPLDPNLGMAYVIPFRNNRKGTTEAQFQIGYRGFIQLAVRTGLFRTINAEEVKEGELQEWDMLTGEIRFIPQPNREALPTIGYVAFFRLSNGFEKTLYMTKEGIEAHAKQYSQTYSSRNDNVQRSSKWATDFDAMARKTVIKLLLSKWAPLSIEMRDAVTSDQGVIDENGRAQYVDNNVVVEEAVAEEIATQANAESLAINETEVVDTTTGELFDTAPAAPPATPQPTPTAGPAF